MTSALSSSRSVTSRVLCLSHRLVLLKYLQGLLTLVGEQLEPVPASKVICDGELIDSTTVPGAQAGPTASDQAT
jgi:hypothetical protein